MTTQAGQTARSITTANNIASQQRAAQQAAAQQAAAQQAAAQQAAAQQAAAQQAAAQQAAAQQAAAQQQATAGVNQGNNGNRGNQGNAFGRGQGKIETLFCASDARKLADIMQPFQTLCATALTSLAILCSGALVLGNGFTPPW